MSEDNSEPLLRVMSLHALAYCERLFYLEEVEEIRVADARVYSGRSVHEAIRKDEEEGEHEWSSFELASETLGLMGKVDAVRRREGGWIPYEHKRGKPRWVEPDEEEEVPTRSRRSRKKSAGSRTAETWPSDALQITAYALLLEDEIGETVGEGRIRYHADNVTVRVPIDDRARLNLKQAIERARQLRRAVDRPPVAENDRLCAKCSLAPVCLPEEERFLEDEKRKTVRLFPADPERRTLHLTLPGSRVSRSANRLKVYDPEGNCNEYPIHEIGALVLHGFVQISTQALHFCSYSHVGVHWLSAGGSYVGAMSGGAPPVQRRVRQYRALSDPATCVRLGRILVQAKAENTLRYILRARRNSNRDTDALDKPIEQIRVCLRKIPGAESIDSLRGLEGIVGREYFAALRTFLRPEVPEEFRFEGRNRRPPRDPFNALLGFIYAMIQKTVLQAILTVGLEPSLGFFHTPRSAAHPLVLDLMELFRLPLGDVIIVGSINRLQWNFEEDFERTGGRVWLSSAGRKKAIALYENRLAETWKHPVIGYSLSYARLVELEVRLLEKEWSGQPGLFGRFRLR